MEVEIPPLHTPWPKEFPELKELDDLLKCAICYEYMQTTLISTCSHSFCSICIRKYLQYENQCPTCFTQCFDNQLRNNRTLDSIIQVYAKVKDKLCHHLRISSVVIPSSSTNKDVAISLPSTSTKQEPVKVQVKSDVRQIEDKNIFKSKKRKPENPAQTPTTPKRIVNDDLDAIEIIEADVHETPRPNTVKNILSSPVSLTSPSISKIRVPDMFTTSPRSFSASSSNVPQDTVPCPVCHVDIPHTNINLHLDNCLLRASGQPPAPSKIEHKLKRLPKLVYTLLSDKDLKKKAKEYGLSILGDRKALISRLKRYTVIYNSECDKAVPRSMMEILQQVEKEEKLEQKANVQTEKPTALFSNSTRCTDQKLINAVNEKYIKENEGTFKALIQKMKDRDGQNIRPTGHVNRIFDDVDAFEPQNQNRIETVFDSGDHNYSEPGAAPTPKRTNSDRLSICLFNGNSIPSPESPVLSNKRVPDQKAATSSRSCPNSFLGNDEEKDHDDGMNDTLNQSNQSFSILDDSQLDFPIDFEPNPEPVVEQAAVNSVDIPEDDHSSSSVEIFVPQNRQRKRKETESSSASSSTFTRRLRKRVDR